MTRTRHLAVELELGRTPTLPRYKGAGGPSMANADWTLQYARRANIVPLTSSMMRRGQLTTRTGIRRKFKPYVVDESVAVS